MSKNYENRLSAQEILVTLSEWGMYAQQEQQEHYEPTHLRKIADVSGAGDAVLSLVALAKVCKLDMKETLVLANLGGGIVCEAPGVVPITAQADTAIRRKLTSLLKRDMKSFKSSAIQLLNYESSIMQIPSHF